MSGRHLDPESGDGMQIARLIASIVAIGLALFLILWLFTGGDDEEPNAATTVTSTDEGTVTTGPTQADPTSAATTSAPQTTTAPTTTVAPTTTAAGPTTTTISARPPGEVTVVVLNAEGTAGLAGDTSERLAEMGYQMGPADDYTEVIDTSRIVHAPNFGAEAFVLAEEFPDAEVSEDAAVAQEWGADVVVILGASYQP